MVGQKLCNSLAIFYESHKEKGKNYTYKHFKNSWLSKASIYKIMKTFDERGSVIRKKGSGRYKALSKKDQTKLIKDVNHKDGVSQRKLANKYVMIPDNITLEFNA